MQVAGHAHVECVAAAGDDVGEVAALVHGESITQPQVQTLDDLPKCNRRSFDCAVHKRRELLRSG
jgi:hypothetical protein